MGALKIKKRIKPINLKINLVFFEFKYEKKHSNKPLGWVLYPIYNALFEFKVRKQIEPGRYEDVEPTQPPLINFR